MQYHWKHRHKQHWAWPVISDTLIPGYSIVTRAMAQDHELTSGNPKKETVKCVIVTLFTSCGYFPSQLREGWSSKQNHESKCLVAPTTNMNVFSEAVNCMNVTVFSSWRLFSLPDAPTKMREGWKSKENHEAKWSVATTTIMLCSDYKSWGSHTKGRPYSI